MLAARLHGARDLRVEPIGQPGAAPAGQVLLSVGAVGICGSDLHIYQDGRTGDAVIDKPIVLGHEFAGVVEAVGDQTVTDGTGQPLEIGTRVAVDPAQPCGACDQCQADQPNLCRRLVFRGQYPHDGALVQSMHVPAGNCYPLPPGITPAEGALLETLGIAIHALRLAPVPPQAAVAVIGAGPVGLCVGQVLGQHLDRPPMISEKLPWRLEAARRLGGTVNDPTQADPVQWALEATGGRGVDVVFEAAWSDESITTAARMLRPGGRLIVIGIPGNDRFALPHSLARRKELSIIFSRRMKHTYPQAIELVNSGKVDLGGLITHRFPLEKAPEAFEAAASYQPGMIKAIIQMPD